MQLPNIFFHTLWTYYTKSTCGIWKQHLMTKPFWNILIKTGTGARVCVFMPIIPMYTVWEIILTIAWKAITICSRYLRSEMHLIEAVKAVTGYVTHDALGFGHAQYKELKICIDISKTDILHGSVSKMQSMPRDWYVKNTKHT